MLTVPERRMGPVSRQFYYYTANLCSPHGGQIRSTHRYRRVF